MPVSISEIEPLGTRKKEIETRTSHFIQVWESAHNHSEPNPDAENQRDAFPKKGNEPVQTMSNLWRCPSPPLRACNRATLGPQLLRRNHVDNTSVDSRGGLGRVCVRCQCRAGQYPAPITSTHWYTRPTCAPFLCTCRTRVRASEDTVPCILPARASKPRRVAHLIRLCRTSRAWASRPCLPLGDRGRSMGQSPVAWASCPSWSAGSLRSCHDCLILAPYPGAFSSSAK